MLIKKELSGLLLVDVQEKLTPHVVNSNELVARCHWLMRLAKALNVPIFVSEQYPEGLGHTVSPLREYSEPDRLSEKVHFSCYQGGAFMPQWRALGKQQIVIAGIETHVCVMQTALDLIQYTDDEVFVVVDAVSSRSEMDHKFGLKRMKQNGVHLVTSEMVFFEWVKCAGTPEFKTLSHAFLMKDAK